MIMVRTTSHRPPFKKRGEPLKVPFSKGGPACLALRSPPAIARLERAGIAGRFRGIFFSRPLTQLHFALSIRFLKSGICFPLCITFITHSARFGKFFDREADPSEVLSAIVQRLFWGLSIISAEQISTDSLRMSGLRSGCT